MAKKGQTVKAKQGGGKKAGKTSGSAAEAVAAAAALTVSEVKRLEEELKESKTRLAKQAEIKAEAQAQLSHLTSECRHAEEGGDSDARATLAEAIEDA